MSETQIKAIKARRRADNLERKLELQKLGYVPKSRKVSEPKSEIPQSRGEDKLEIPQSQGEDMNSELEAKIERLLNEVKELRGERLEKDVSDIKAGIATLLGHNQSFPLGQILGTLQTSKCSGEPIIITQPVQPQPTQQAPQTQQPQQQPHAPAVANAPAEPSQIQKMLAEMNTRMDELGKELE